jgi:hypothetical protein
MKDIQGSLSRALSGIFTTLKGYPVTVPPELSHHIPLMSLTLRKKGNLDLISALAFPRAPSPLNTSLPTVDKGCLICIDERLHRFRHILPQISLKGPIPRCTIHGFHKVLRMSIVLPKI